MLSNVGSVRAQSHASLRLFSPQIAHPVICFLRLWKDSSCEQFPKIAIANFYLNGPDSRKPITFELGPLFSHDAVWRLCYDFALLVFS